MNRRTKGAILASAVATMFLATAALAQEAASPSGGSVASVSTVKCFGVNSCKGHGSCKSAHNDCKGQNACKGKGFVENLSADQCTEQGGHTES